MKRIILIILILSFMCVCVSADDLTAPEVPEMGRPFMPEDTGSFVEALWLILKTGISSVQPELAAAFRLCFRLSCAGMLLSVFQTMKGIAKQAVALVSVLMIGGILLETGNTMILLASEAVTTISEYGKLLLPVMATTLAAQGWGASSAALYTSSVIFCTVLSKLISNLLIPGVYIFLALSVAAGASENQTLTAMQQMIMRFEGWALKTLLSIFTGFMAITGVVSGTTDATAAKLTKAAIAGMVPVVGGILSDATESVLIGASMVKNAAGIYGLLAAAAVCIGPFLHIGIQYLLLKVTGVFCQLFSIKQVSQIIRDFSGAMGMLLGMTGACTILLVISIICFMKGVA